MDYGFVLGYNSLYNSKSNANTHKLQIYRYKTLPENTKFVVKNINNTWPMKTINVDFITV